VIDCPGVVVELDSIRLAAHSRRNLCERRLHTVCTGCYLCRRKAAYVHVRCRHEAQLVQVRGGLIEVLAADAVARWAREWDAARSASGTTVVDNTTIECASTR
jgi:hypothetical protein